VSPGAATEGVAHIFGEKTGDLLIFLVITVCQFCGVTPVSFHLIFLLITVTFIDFTRVSLPEGCHPQSDLICPLFFVNLPTNFFPSGVTA